MTKHYSITDSDKLTSLGYIYFAQIGRPHGLKGAFFLKTEDRRTVWDKYESILLETPSGFSEKKVIKHFLSGNALALELEGLSTRSEIEALYNKKIFVHQSQIKIKEDEFLVSELTNFQVVNSEKGVLGRVVGVISYGAQENLEIELSESAKQIASSPDSTVLYPFIDKYILNIDYEKKQIEVEYLEDFFVN